MTLWTRLGFLIPIFWALGFVVILTVDHFAPDFIPDHMLFTIGHLIGTIFVWFFSLTFGETKISEVMNVETGEKTILERPHKFLMFSPIIWGLLLTAALGWFLYRPPPKSWLDLATQKQAEIQRSIIDAGNQAKEKITKDYEMRDWESKEGKKLRAKLLRIETIDGVKTVFVLSEKDNAEKSFPMDRLSEKDLEYVKERGGQ